MGIPTRRQAVLAESSESGMPQIVYPRKYLPTTVRCYCVTNKEQHDLAKKYPNQDIQLGLDQLSAYLIDHKDQIPKTSAKAKLIIDWWFSGASVTR